MQNGCENHTGYVFASCVQETYLAGTASASLHWESTLKGPRYSPSPREELEANRNLKVIPQKANETLRELCSADALSFVYFSSSRFAVHCACRELTLRGSAHVITTGKIGPKPRGTPQSKAKKGKQNLRKTPQKRKRPSENAAPENAAPWPPSPLTPATPLTNVKTVTHMWENADEATFKAEQEIMKKQKEGFMTAIQVWRRVFFCVYVCVFYTLLHHCRFFSQVFFSSCHFRCGACGSIFLFVFLYVARFPAPL